MRKAVTRARAAMDIPKDELWLHEPKARKDLRRALAWARRSANPQQTILRVGTARDFFELGRKYGRLARTGKRLPKSHLITVEDRANIKSALSPERSRSKRQD